MQLQLTFPIVLGFCIYLTLFAGIVFGCNYAFRKLAEGKTAILIPIALDAMFILYYALPWDFSTETNALEYLYASHLPFVAMSFCRRILKFQKACLRIGKCVFGASILLYVFAIGYIVLAVSSV